MQVTAPRTAARSVQQALGPRVATPNHANTAALAILVQKGPPPGSSALQSMLVLLELRTRMAPTRPQVWWTVCASQAMGRQALARAGCARLAPFLLEAVWMSALPAALGSRVLRVQSTAVTVMLWLKSALSASGSGSRLCRRRNAAAIRASEVS